MDRSQGSVGYRLRIIALQVGSVALAALLLLLALRAVDPAELRAAVADAEYAWVVPLVGAAMLSHLIRAWRWNLIIASMPTRGDRGAARLPRLSESFGALLVGYMVNYALPRAGEVARAGVLARRTGLSFAGLIGTVAAERVLDVVSLAVALASVAVLMRRQLGAVAASMTAGASPLLLLLALVGLALAAAALLFVLRLIANRRPGSRIATISSSFLDGIGAILRLKHIWLVLIQTLAIWGCYWIMAYIPLRMLGLTRIYGLGFAEAWSIMNIGAIGVLIPSPGGLGSYHLITVEVLHGLFAVHPSAAASYAVLTHGIQFVAYVVAGAIALSAFGLSLKGVVTVEGASGQDARAEDDGKSIPGISPDA